MTVCDEQDFFSSRVEKWARQRQEYALRDSVREPTMGHIKKRQAMSFFTHLPGI
jgi:hypothetical protein